MIFEHLEAFMTDSIHYICRKCPNVLNKKKKITWEKALSFESRRKLIDYLSEELCYEFIRESTFEKRLEFFHDIFNIKNPVPENHLRALEIMKKIRNLIVHNGGKVNQSFLDFLEKFEEIPEILQNLNLETIEVDDPIPLTKDTITCLSLIALNLIGFLLVKISQNFFEIEISIVEDLSFRKKERKSRFIPRKQVKV